MSTLEELLAQRMLPQEPRKPTPKEAFWLITMIPVSALIRGWTLQKFWLWFVTPIGLGPIGFFQALGLVVLLQVFTKASVEVPGFKQDDHVIGKAFGESILGPLAVLFVGWCIAGLM